MLNEPLPFIKLRGRFLMVTTLKKYAVAQLSSWRFKFKGVESERFRPNLNLFTTVNLLSPSRCAYNVSAVVFLLCANNKKSLNRESSLKIAFQNYLRFVLFNMQISTRESVVELSLFIFFR